MRRSLKRGLVAAAAATLVLAGCADDESDDQAAPDGTDAEDLNEGDLDDLLGDQEDLEDPGDSVDDGVYRANGVVLPVPDGWSLDPNAHAQGAALALSDDGQMQLSAQAVDAEEAEAAGQPMDFDTLLDSAREIGDAEVDEEVELEGAERAHRLVFAGLPSPQEGGPEQSGMIILAEDGAGLVGEFAFGASSDAYDDSFEDVLLEGAGFDPDSAPPEAPAGPAPAPEGGEMEELPEELEDLD